MMYDSGPGNRFVNHPTVSKTEQRQLDAGYCINNNLETQKPAPIQVIDKVNTMVSAVLTADVQIQQNSNQQPITQNMYV
jgi:hypothetical protein